MEDEHYTILGTGGFALELSSLLASASRTVEGFVGPEPEIELPAPWLGEDRVIPELPPEMVFLLAIGEPRMREEVFKLVRAAGFRVGRFVHPAAWLAEGSNLGEGCIIYPNATVHAGVSLGAGVLVNSNASIGHETQIGPFCNVGPGASVGGRCRLGEKVYVGIGATLIEDIEIVAGTVVGAGSVVVKSLKKVGVYVGVPVRRRPQ
ncbi:acetyltransferase [Nitrospiraceae bacterium AH_259_D15_M11_P09]|nr:acetyltransferase [Nitrospiraceae bacterium AH_259_D15_M11_P09]